ncbi:MAG: hypothetical protein R2710_21550 [Acidimicrobiales bacterium]
MDQSNAETNRLRSALFSAADAASNGDPTPTDRVLVRSGRPMRKRTPSDLGHPNGKRSLGFGR